MPPPCEQSTAYVSSAVFPGPFVLLKPKEMLQLRKIETWARYGRRIINKRAQLFLPSAPLNLIAGKLITMSPVQFRPLDKVFIIVCSL